jgi:hypothetical protein
MGRPLKIAKAFGKSSKFNNPPGETNTYGVVGGDTNILGSQIVVRIKIGANPETDGWIVRQKGRSKFLVATDLLDSSIVQGICTLADLADGALTDNTMTVTTSAGRLKRLTNRWGHTFDNVKHRLSFNALPDTAQVDTDVIPDGSSL